MIDLDAQRIGLQRRIALARLLKRSIDRRLALPAPDRNDKRHRDKQRDDERRDAQLRLAGLCGAAACAQRSEIGGADRLTALVPVDQISECRVQRLPLAAAQLAGDFGRENNLRRGAQEHLAGAQIEGAQFAVLAGQNAGSEFADRGDHAADHFGIVGAPGVGAPVRQQNAAAALEQQHALKIRAHRL
jgi:hypothetical protein